MDPTRYESQKEVAAYHGKIKIEVAPKIGYKSFHEEVFQSSKRPQKP
jgi:hypothetical protein